MFGRPVVSKTGVFPFRCLPFFEDVCTCYRTLKRKKNKKKLIELDPILHALKI